MFDKNLVEDLWRNRGRDSWKDWQKRERKKKLCGTQELNIGGILKKGWEVEECMEGDWSK